jgi:hypothetical protein
MNIKTIIVITGLVIVQTNIYANKAYYDKEQKINIKVKKTYPIHWVKRSEIPFIQTMDHRSLPGGYGMGSTTLANWINNNIKLDEEEGLKTMKNINNTEL